MSKPTLYTFEASVWAAVPELAIAELGYGPDDIEVKVINLIDGENFQPWFININPNASLPTLSVGDKHFTDSTTVTQWIIENAPKKAGITPKSRLLSRIHEDSLDPNFALLLARDDKELKLRAGLIAVRFLTGRQKALKKYSEHPDASHHADFYEGKLAANGHLVNVYEGNVSPEAKNAFYSQSQAHWDNLRGFILNELPNYLPEDGAFIGGEVPCEYDFHLGGWLARIVATIGGKDIHALEPELKEPVPAKVAKYWETWSSKESWKAVYAKGLH